MSLYSSELLILKNLLTLDLLTLDLLLQNFGINAKQNSMCGVPCANFQKDEEIFLLAFEHFFLLLCMILQHLQKVNVVFCLQNLP